MATAPDMEMAMATTATKAVGAPTSVAAEVALGAATAV